MVVLTVLLFTLAYGSGDTKEISKQKRFYFRNDAFIRRITSRSIVEEKYVLKDEKNADEKFDFTNYSDNFAKKVMFPISAAAYSSDPSKCLRETLGFEKGIHQFSYQWRKGQWKSSGYVAQLHKYHAIALGFRGTDSIHQFVQLVIDSFKKPWSKWEYGGQVSYYFNKAFHEVWSGLEGHLYNYVNEHPDWDIWISGHSVGGALATLAAAFLVQSKYIEDPKKVKLVTFGQPMVGDHQFAENFDKMGIYAYRVVHWFDLVPGILQTGYQHQGKEVFDGPKDEHKTYVVCKSVEDHYNCSESYDPASEFDHNYYFGKRVSIYGMKGCKN